MKRLVFLQLIGCMLFAVIIMLLYMLGVFSPLSVIIVYLLMGLANIVNARTMLMKPIEDLSTHDKLTGCHNRSKLELKIPEYEKYTEYTIIFFDVNNLKLMNDIHGHTIGDKILVEASNQLRFWHKYGDLYRLGGDEFIVVVTNMTKEHLELIISEWYSTLHPLNEEFNDEFVCNLSYGIFCNEGKDSLSFKDVMELADEKMYEMKKRIKGSKPVSG